MVGTKAFPSLRLRGENVLPKQSAEDDYNCGIGVVATIGIILRDVIGFNLEDDTKFGTIFAKNKLSVAFASGSKEHLTELQKIISEQVLVKEF